jgi:coenzyme PQQ biosynthesis protein PqqD
MTIAPSARPRLAGKARLRHDRFTGKDMLLYPERGLSLNAVGAAVARRCDGTRTVAAIAAEIAAEFPGAEPGEIERDVLEFLERLAERGLVEDAG